MHTTSSTDLNLGTPLAFRGDAALDARAAARATHPVRFAGVDEYRIELATDRAADPLFVGWWEALVADGASPQKIYQTPAYYRFAVARRKPGERIELLAISRLKDGALVGVVPVRAISQAMRFNIGPLGLFQRQVTMVSLLGSIPAAAADKAMSARLYQRILALFPEAKAVSLQALPRDSAHWAALQGLGAAGSGLLAAPLGQWRECHTLPLPASFELYLEKFSAKKRYNLNRQLRQLSDKAGALELVRVTQREQVGPMAAALALLLTPAEQGAMPAAASLEALAAEGLLHCYLLQAGGQTVAAVIATRSPQVLHIHNIFVDRQYLSLSIGTSVMHLTIKDVAGMGGFQSLDFGYGSPGHEYRSSHVLETRAQVLVFRRAAPARLLFGAHAVFHHVAEGLIAQVKAARKQWHNRRKSNPA